MIIILPLLVLFAPHTSGDDARPPGVPSQFVELSQIIPDLVIDLRYCGTNNFVGTPIEGYTQHRCWLTSKAAKALARVQEELRPFGLGLKVFDAYRPQTAVNHFVRWVQSPHHSEQKSQFYPNVEKSTLITGGYISDRSGHSRGSSLDLTLVSHSQEPKDAPKELDMGTSFDFFGEESHTNFPQLTPVQRQNRLLLKLVMERHGFVNYSKEWWHYRFKQEPYPDTYFNFPTGGIPSSNSAATEQGSSESPKAKEAKER